MLTIGFMMIASHIAAYEIANFFYYITDWAFLTTVFSILATIKATKYSAWQKAAVISTELALGLNLLITPMFWIGGAPFLYPKLPWSIEGFYEGMSQFNIHTFPIICTLTNIYMSDVQLVVADYKKVFLFAMLYMVGNAVGTYEKGEPIYPYADWSCIPLTIVYYSILALMIGGAYKYAAGYVNTKLPFNVVRE
mmetsp:Transcript_1428/g.2507  ORF Transcript_1428/g.2507 Transcript_1428/m.2507 type:complete len:194 (-) Transcript_1428:53-634(-)